MIQPEIAMLADRSSSPMNFRRYDRLKKHMKKGETAKLNQRNQPKAYEYYAQPIGPEPAPQIQAPQPNHPILRNLGIAGIGAGLGIAAYHYRNPLMKLGQKAVNYATDKFHHLFSPTNETNSSPQIANRAAF